MTERTVTGEPITRRPAIELDLAPREWLLSFVAGCSVVLDSQVAKLLTIRDDVPADLVARLRVENLIVDAARLRRHSGAYRITAEGLRVIGSDLPVPRVDVRRYWSEVGAGWLAVRARCGSFGSAIERLYTRREMVAADRRLAEVTPVVDPAWSDAVRAKAADASFAVRLSDLDGVDDGMVHYPDLTVVVAQGRVAMELLLVLPGRARLEEIVGAYARKPQLTSAILIVPSVGMRELVAEAIKRRGASERVFVQQARFALG